MTSKKERTPAQIAALEAARAQRAIARERIAPEGYRSVEHFLDDAREYIARQGLTTDLARYLRVDESSVRRWIKREKIPMQSTLDTIHQWMRTKKSGL